jgi:Dolichyl-phosphate-mannose-protein mannosyltransferase
MKQKLYSITIWHDIRFWILFLFAVRLIGITNPPVEVGHNWRQTTVTMVARNFVEVDNNIFYPRIDIAGQLTGITGMEFPLLNYAIYVISKIFGYAHWYGRLINLMVSSIGLLYFYKLIKKYDDHSIAFYSTIVLAVSIWFSFSRKIMPDTMSMSLVIAAVYFGSIYLDNVLTKKQSVVYLCLYALFIILGVLSKLPSGFILIVFVGIIFNKNIKINKKIVFCVVSIICMLPILYWYYKWVPHLVSTFGFWHFFMGKSITEGFSEILLNMPETLKKFYDTALKFIGFSVFIYGLITSIILKQHKVYILFLLGLIGFSVVMGKAGYTFYHHNYYIIPFVPFMSLVAGYGIYKIANKKIAYLVLLFIGIEGIANQLHDFRVNENIAQLLLLEKDLDKVSVRSDLIIINAGNYPTPMYLAHRKGWVTTNEKILDNNYIENLKIEKLKFIVILKKCFGTSIVLPNYKKVLENNNYDIYQL